MRLILGTVLAGLSFLASAQEYTGEAKLPDITGDGFYRVQLKPELTRWLEHDCSNVRIIGSTGTEIPYIIEEAEESSSISFKEYTILEKAYTKSCCTSIVFENKTGNVLNNLLIRIRNAETRKSATLLGSEDRKQWFALKENLSFNYISNDHETSEVRVVNFPLSDYPYYMLKIDDSLSAPLNILKIGYNENYKVDATYTPIQNVSIVTSDSAILKQTFCYITFDTMQWVDQLYLAAGGTPFFKRRASMYEVNRFRDKRGRFQKSLQHLSAFELSSNGPTVLNLKGSLAKEWVIIIDNDDNPSLKIDSVGVFQLNRFLTAYLKQSESYTLKTANGLSRPIYDLELFKSSIPGTAPEILPGPYRLFADGIKSTKDSTFFNSTLWIWGAIIAIILVLGMMSLRMIRETKTGKET